MRNLIIVGTGAVAAELTSYIEDQNANIVKKVKLLGYLDYEYNRDKYWSKYRLSHPIICDIDQYMPNENEEILIGISDITFRNKMIDILLERGAKISSFVHHSSIISSTAKLGIGNIIYPFCIVGPNAVMGDFNLITSYSFISHDCIVGNKNFLSTAGIAGRVKVGHNNFFGIRATILPNVNVGNNNVIQAGMIVDKNVGDNSTIFYRYKEQVYILPQESING